MVAVMWWLLWCSIVLTVTEAQTGSDTTNYKSELTVQKPNSIKGLGAVGERCDRSWRCARGLTCRYPRRGAKRGVCKVPVGHACIVAGHVYHHGEYFSTDCRTQCVCQNGTYACASKCPQENILPRGDCTRPRLVDLPGQCCREWLCDPPPVQSPPLCVEDSTEWSRCSTFSGCGGGVSRRISNSNPSCKAMNETRLCQQTPCSGPGLIDHRGLAEHHRIRKGHVCKASRRLGRSRFRVGPCTSIRRYHPKQCGGCLKEGSCCAPVKLATINVAMACPSSWFGEGNLEEVLAGYLETGKDIWRAESRKSNHDKPRAQESISVKVEWVLKCQCGEKFCDIGPRLHRVHRTVSP